MQARNCARTRQTQSFIRALATMSDQESHSRLILEEYKIWKRATPFLYDVVVSHVLEWCDAVAIFPQSAHPLTLLQT
jgi:hypothetical protein